MLSNNHWTVKYFKQRMTTKEWKNILLEEKDTIIYHGLVVKLKAKKMGYGVVEVSKDLEDIS